MEIIFEHRNYLPSMFFFLPAAMAFCVLTEKYSSRRTMLQFIFLFLTVFIFAQGHTVYMRNALFQKPKLLWKDNAEKAPDLHRPHHNLANAYFVEGRIAEALLETQKALQAKTPAVKGQKFITWYNLGLFFLYEGSIQKALACYEKALEIKPSDARIYHKLAVASRIDGRLDNAEAYANEALRRSRGSGVFLPTLGMILLQKGKIEPVLQMAVEELKKPGSNNQWYYILGEALRKKGELKRSALYFEIYARLFPDQMAANASLVEIFSLMGRESEKEWVARRLFFQAGDIGLETVLKQYHRQYNTLDERRIERIQNAVCQSLQCKTIFP